MLQKILILSKNGSNESCAKLKLSGSIFLFTPGVELGAPKMCRVQSAMHWNGKVCSL